MKKQEVYINMFDVVVVFTYGKKSYAKYLKNHYNLDKELKHAGVTVELQSDRLYDIVIGIRKCKNIDDLRHVMVHEISHVTTYIMNHYGIECDEFRAYLTQYLYKKGQDFIEKVH